MRPIMLLSIFAIALGASAAQSAPYSVTKTAKTGGDGGFDYVYADTAGRGVYVPRSAPATPGTPPPHIDVFNLDTLAPVGSIPGYSAHGAAVDPKTNHGFATSKPVVMFDSKT